MATFEEAFEGTVGKSPGDLNAIVSDQKKTAVERFASSLVAPAWDDSNFKSAISSGTCVVAFAGTSITEGYVAQAESENIWVAQFKRMLAEKYPSVAFDFYNFGLASRKLSHFVDASYVGLAAEPSNKNDGYFREQATDAWESASVEGQSWMDKVASVSPDLVVINYGMNDTQDDDVFAENLRAAITSVRAFTSTPSVVVATEMLPVSSFDRYDLVSQYSRLSRLIAISERCGLIDTGRVCQFAKDGKDYFSPTYQRLTTIADWVVTGSPTNHTDSGFRAGTSVARIQKNGDYFGGKFSFNFTPAATNSSFSVSVCVPSGSAYAVDSITVVRTGAKFQIYDKLGHLVVGMNTPAMVADTVEAIDIRINCGHVAIYRDGALVGTRLIDTVGTVGGLDISVTNANLTGVSVDVGSPSVVNFDYYSDVERLGSKSAATGWNSGDYLEGGNSENHPSRLSLKEIFGPAVQSFIKSL